MDWRLTEDICQKSAAKYLNSDFSCNAGWDLFNRHCYKVFFHDTLLTWIDSEDLCNQFENGHLVSIRDEDEMLYVHLLLLEEDTIEEDGTYIGKCMALL